MKTCRAGSWLALLLTLAACLIQDSPARAQESEREAALKNRVNEFYTLLQLGRPEAADFVVPEHREHFRNEQRTPFLGWQVESVKMEADGRSATVVTRMQIFTGFTPTPAAVARTGLWRLIDGKWHVEIPKPDPKAMQNLFSSARGKAGPVPNSNEELKFKGHRYGLGVMRAGDVRVARFPFTNIAGHAVTLASVATSCDCLVVKTEKKEYRPGESGELAIEFNSSDYSYNYEQTIVVKTSPGDRVSHLTIGAYVIPPSRAEKPPAETKAGLSKP